MKRFVATANNGDYNHCLGVWDNYYEALGHVYCDVREYLHMQGVCVLAKDGVIDRDYDNYMHWLVERDSKFAYEVYLYKFDPDEEGADE